VFRRRKTFLVTVDLIPIFCIDRGDFQELFIEVVRTLVTKKPPSWLNYFNMLQHKDVFVPAEEGSQRSADQLQVSVKLLHHGPDQNYIIRPFQRLNNIRTMQDDRYLKKVYVRAKALKDLLRVDSKSYLIKKVILSTAFRIRLSDDLSDVDIEGDTHSEPRLLANALFNALSDEHLKRSFEVAIDFDAWKALLQSGTDFDRIPLISQS
jgi:hypothetical protein